MHQGFIPFNWQPHVKKKHRDRCIFPFVTHISFLSCVNNLRYFFQQAADFVGQWLTSESGHIEIRCYSLEALQHRTVFTFSSSYFLPCLSHFAVITHAALLFLFSFFFAVSVLLFFPPSHELCPHSPAFSKKTQYTRVLSISSRTHTMDVKLLSSKFVFLFPVQLSGMGFSYVCVSTPFLLHLFLKHKHMMWTHDEE